MERVVKFSLPRGEEFQGKGAVNRFSLFRAFTVFALLWIGFLSVQAQTPVNEWVLSPANIDVTTVKDLAGNEDGLLHGRMATIQKPPALYFDGTDTYIELSLIHI